MLNRHHQPRQPSHQQQNQTNNNCYHCSLTRSQPTPLSQVISKEQDHIENVWKMYYRARHSLPYQKEWKT